MYLAVLQVVSGAREGTRGGVTGRVPRPLGACGGAKGGVTGPLNGGVTGPLSGW